MGFQRENFVGNPHKQEIGDDDEELEYLSGDEIDFNPFGLPAGDPDLILDDNYDIITDDDEDYDPEDDYEEFLSDSDYEYEGADGSEESGSEQGGDKLEAVITVINSDSDPEEPAVAAANTQDSSHKASGDNKSVDNKVSGEVKTTAGGDVSSNEADPNT